MEREAQGGGVRLEAMRDRKVNTEFNNITVAVWIKESAKPAGQGEEEVTGRVRREGGQGES